MVLPPESADFEVVRVIDGDTLLLRPGVPSGGEMRVRLLGIDCPESVAPNQPVEPWGPEAAAFTTEFVSAGFVELRYDKRRIDRYGRYLAYVFVDGRMLNEELVRHGLARVWTFPGDSESIARQMRKAEKEARQHGRGIWSAAE